MRSRSITAVPNYLAFEASFPTEGGWIGDEPDPKNPPGRELIEFLLSVVSPGTPVAELWDEGGYGWAFNCTVNDITVSVLVQRLDYWLVIPQEVSLKPRFLRGPKYREAVLTVCRLIHEVAQTDERFSNFRALTDQEHVELERAKYERTNSRHPSHHDGGAA